MFRTFEMTHVLLHCAAIAQSEQHNQLLRAVGLSDNRTRPMDKVQRNDLKHSATP